MEKNQLTDKTIYDLSYSQFASYTQLLYTPFKCVINILISAETDKKLDFDIMKQAFNKIVERNDCLRMRFFMDKKELKQYFIPEDKFENIPVLTFKTKAEQEKFLKKTSKPAIKFLKGKVVEPYFINTYDGKSMILLKVCHLILDLYGLNIIFNDLFAVYDALKNNTPLPTAPGSFEEVLQKDLAVKHNDIATEKIYNYFENLYNSSPRPSYVGIHGNYSKVWLKQKKAGKYYMKRFIINNQTKGYAKEVSPEYVIPAIEYCKSHNTTISNFFFYCYCLALSKINDDTRYILPIELCNCRGTLKEKQCGGTKVLSIKGSHMNIDGEKTFAESVVECGKMQSYLYRYMSFKDIDMAQLLNKCYGLPFLGSVYPAIYSFVPYCPPDNVNFKVYSNGRFSEAAYIAVMYNEKDNCCTVNYDCQKKVTSDESIAAFHNAYLQIIKQVVENQDILIKDIKVN